MALDMDYKKEVIQDFSRGENDTGSPEVQIAIFSKRIANLTEHLKINKKDHSSRLGLLKLVGKRRRLMRYLKSNNLESYHNLIEKLNIRDNI